MSPSLNCSPEEGHSVRHWKQPYARACVFHVTYPV